MTFSPFEPPKLSERERTFLASELGDLTSDERKNNARRWGLVNGYTGREGGWIYSPKGEPVCQGWFSFFLAMRFRMLEDVTGGAFKVIRSRRQ